MAMEKAEVGRRWDGSETAWDGLSRRRGVKRGDEVGRCDGRENGGQVTGRVARTRREGESLIEKSQSVFEVRLNLNKSCNHEKK